MNDGQLRAALFIEANGQNVATGLNGPYFATATAGGPINFTISGVANQPIILLSGPLNPGVLSFPGNNQLDIGVFNATPPFIPAGIIILADGVSGSGLLGPFFVTNGAGTMSITLSSGGLPMGLLGTFQAVVYNGGPSVTSMTNAVQLTIM